jgi:hypothetical protein
MVSSYEKHHFAGELRKIERLLTGRVTPADDIGLLASIEHAIASGTVGDSPAEEFLLSGKAGPPWGGPGGVDERGAMNFL